MQTDGSMERRDGYRRWISVGALELDELIRVGGVRETGARSWRGERRRGGRRRAAEQVVGARGERQFARALQCAHPLVALGWCFKQQSTSMRPMRSE